MNFNSIRQLIDSCKPKREERRIIPTLTRPYLPRPEPVFVNEVPHSYKDSEIESIELRTTKTIFKVGDVIQTRTLNNPVTINSYQYDNNILTFTYTDSMGNVCCNSVTSHAPWFKFQGDPVKLQQIEYNFVDLSDNNIEWQIRCERKRNNSIIYNVVIQGIKENTLDTLNMILSAHDRMCASDFVSNDSKHIISLSDNRINIVSFEYTTL